MSFISARTVFDTLFLVADIVEFNSEWNNGTGYYDGAVHLPLSEGDMVRFISPEPNNRKGIIFNTPHGNVVVFERFTNGANDIFVSNEAKGAQHAIGYGSSNLSADDIMVIAASVVHVSGDLPELVLVDNINSGSGRETILCEYIKTVKDGAGEDNAYIVRSYSDKKLYLKIYDSEDDQDQKHNFRTRYFSVGAKRIDQQCVNQEQVIAALEA